MFNRSKKYIVLLIINIVILTAIYLNKEQADDNDPFTTEYVIGLLENEEKFAKNVVKLNDELDVVNAQLADAEIQLEQTQLLISTSEQKYRVCENEKENILQNARETAKQQAKIENNDPVASCDAEILEISIAKAQNASLESLISELREKFSQTQEELIRKNQLLSQIQRKNDSEVEELRNEVNNLKRALSEPIAIENNFLSARFCTKAKFESLICVQEFLVRPSFTKLPITRLGIKVLDKDGDIAAQGEFNSAKSQLYRLTLGRGKEIAAGTYTVEYQIDNQSLVSEPVELIQK